MTNKTKVEVNPHERVTMTTLNQSSHLKANVKQAMLDLARKEEELNLNHPPKHKTKRDPPRKALPLGGDLRKKNWKLETDDLILLFVIYLLIKENYEDKIFIIALIWVFFEGWQGNPFK